MDKQWTDEKIKKALADAGYELHSITLPFTSYGQYYYWVQKDVNGKIVWSGSKFQAAKRARLFSFKAY